MSELSFTPAHELVAMLSTGQISSSELLDHYLARIKDLDEGTNAVVTLAATRARKEAKRADRSQASGDLLGPLPVSYTHLTLPTNREV